MGSAAAAARGPARCRVGLKCLASETLGKWMSPPFDWVFGLPGRGPLGQRAGGGAQAAWVGAWRREAAQGRAGTGAGLHSEREVR